MTLKRSLVICMALGSTTLSVSATAQETPLDDDEIVVTAAKRPQALDEIDGQVRVVRSDDLDPRGFQGVEQLDRVFADLSIRSRSSRAFANVTIRGQSSVDFYNPSAQLYVDGLPQDQTLFFQLLPVGLNRVETLYGPQGTLYGRGAVGGVINVVTARPGDDFRVQGVGVATELGETGQALVNIPLGKGFAADGLFAARREKGELIGLTTGARLGGARSGNGRARLSYAPDGGGVDILASWQRSVVRSGEEYFVPGAFFDQRKVIEAPSHYRLQTDSYGMTAAFDLGFATLTSLTGYQDRDLDRTIFGTYRPETQTTFSQELRLASPATGMRRFDYVAGLYYEKLHFRGGLPVFALTADQNIRTMAAFGELTWHVSDRIDVTPGIRISNESTHAETALGPTALDNRKKATSLLPKLSIGFEAADTLRLYAVFSTGFKAGGFTRAVTPATIAFSYQPQRSYNYELGGRYRSPEGRVEASLAAYYILSTDYQLSVGPANGMYLQNVGRTKGKGVNLNLYVEPVDGLVLTMAAARNDSWFSSYDNPANPGVDLTGNKLPYAPDTMVNANLRYAVDLGGGRGSLSPHGGFSLIGKTWFDELNMIAQKRYAILDGGLTWNTGRGVAVDLYGDNLTDRRHATYAFAVPGIGSAFQLGRGREFGVRVRLGL